MVRLDARLGEIWGFLPLIFGRGHFYEIGIAAILFRVKPSHVEKFRKFRFADVVKSELGKKRKKHAQNIRSTVHRTGDLNRWSKQFYEIGRIALAHESFNHLQPENVSFNWF